MYIDWKTNIIHVPKSFMTVVQLTPTEIYELDLNVFRLELKNIEDDEEGINFPRTHNHNPPVNVGGVTLARVVEILEPYTVTFEDDQYAVNLFGANSNVADRVNPNQVSVRSANSAGLVNSAEIEYGSFNNAVWINQVDGTPGTVYPTGTPRQPVNNITDAVLIAQRRGFDTLQIVGSLNILTEDVSGFKIVGQSAPKTILYVASSANVTDCEFYDLTLTGTLDGGSLAFRCAISNITYVNGGLTECYLLDQITMGGTTALNIINCVSGIAGPSPVIIDMGGDCGPLMVRNYSGGLKIQNKTGTDSVSLDISQGTVTLDSTVTNGDIVCRGVGILTNDSTGSAVVYEEMLDPKNLNNSLYADGAVYIDTSSPNSGTLFPVGTFLRPVNNVADAKTIADNIGLQKYKVHGTVTITSAHNHWTFEGASTILTDIIILTGQSLIEPKFLNCTVTGTLNGTNQQYDRCFITNVDEIDGLSLDSAVSGNITLTEGASFLCQNLSVASNVNINLNGIGSLLQASLSNDGTFTISGAGAGSVSQVSLRNMGSVTLDNTNVAGSVFSVSGTGTVINNTTGSTVIDSTHKLYSTTQIATAVRDELDEELTDIDEMHKLQGLQPASPLVVTTTSRTAGVSIEQTITGDETEVTVTRQ